LASLNKIPIIDADFVGRAFPELQMNSACVSGINQSVSWITDIFGNTVELNLSCPNTLERYARNITVAAGSRVAFSMYPMSGAQAKCGAVVAGSISRALLIGNTILKARETQADPIEQLAQKSHGIIIGSGVITDIDQTIKNGFLQGTVTIMGPQGEIKIFLQNEYLIIKVNNNIRVTTPDIIALLEKDTGTPLLSSTLSYGIRVVVIILPAPTVWQTQKGLSLVGPRVFGYNCDYVNVTAPAGAVTSK
jgi:DUF917 family protein